jgi:hypothetical protein
MIHTRRHPRARLRLLALVAAALLFGLAAGMAVEAQGAGGSAPPKPGDPPSDPPAGPGPGPGAAAAASASTGAALGAVGAAAGPAGGGAAGLAAGLAGGAAESAGFGHGNGNGTVPAGAANENTPGDSSPGGGSAASGGPGSSAGQNRARPEGAAAPPAPSGRRSQPLRQSDLGPLPDDPATRQDGDHPFGFPVIWIDRMTRNLVPAGPDPRPSKSPQPGPSRCRPPWKPFTSVEE